jgi:hypothetical protein
MLGIVALGLATGAGCVGVTPGPPPPVPALEIAGAWPLRVSVSEVQRRALSPAERPAYAAEGYRWDFELRFAAPPDVGAKFTRLGHVTRSLSGVAASKEEPFALDVHAGLESRVTAHAVLWSSTPGDALGLSGSHELTFHGTDSRGTALAVLVRVPLR